MLIPKTHHEPGRFHFFGSRFEVQRSTLTSNVELITIPVTKLRIPSFPIWVTVRWKKLGNEQPFSNKHASKEVEIENEVRTERRSDWSFVMSAGPLKSESPRALLSQAIVDVIHSLGLCVPSVKFTCGLSPPGPGRVCEGTCPPALPFCCPSFDVPPVCVCAGVACEPLD